MFKTTVVFFLTTILLFLMNAEAYAAYYGYGHGRDHRHVCHRYRYEFKLNVANVNALVALNCSALSHIENERKNMTYEDSATMFHQWTVTGSSPLITVRGYCAIPYANLKDNDISKYEIDLQFKKVSDTPYKVKVDGTIVGKNLGLNFSNNHFLDSRCAESEMSFNRLDRISLGLGFGLQDIVSIFRSGRTSAALQVLETESWAQGNARSDFSDVGLQYRMGQFNGRQLGFSLTKSPSGSDIYVRSANYLEYAEGTDFFDFEKGSFDHVNGFLNYSLPVNHKFQAYNIIAGSQIRGCSSLIYESELDRPQDVDLETCKRKLDNSKLKVLLRDEYVTEVTRENREADALKIKQQQVINRVNDMLNKAVGPVANYSHRPGIHEQSRRPWRQADIDRGYVVTQRYFTFATTNKEVVVTEHRYDVNGKHYIVEHKLETNI